MDYYDKLVIAIPALLAAGLAASIHPAVAVYQGLVAGSLASTAVVFEMLFRNPPVERTVADYGAVVIWGFGLTASLLMYSF